MVNPSLSKQEMDLIHRSTKKIKVAPPDNTVKHEALKGSPANEQKNSNSQEKVGQGKNGSSDQNSAKRNPGSRFNVLAEKQEDHEEANEKLEIINNIATLRFSRFQSKKSLELEIQRLAKTIRIIKLRETRRVLLQSNVKELGKGVGVPKTNKDTNNN
ncbi:HTH-type transcriptional regulator/antitoxin HigA [Sesbania bispinosa]|nr:HTH-type transcriptional regulator/antitoxin HigA [Sesbania bispinosa]